MKTNETSPREIPICGNCDRDSTPQGGCCSDPDPLVYVDGKPVSVAQRPWATPPSLLSHFNALAAKKSGGY